MNEDSSFCRRSASEGILGGYQLLAEIGRGRLASVFLALAPTAQGLTHVVIKELHSELVEDGEFRAILSDEGYTAVRFDHPNVVKTFDLHIGAEGCFFVMEFLDGQPLSRIRQRANRGQAFPPSIHLRALADVLQGLHYLHELTDVHERHMGLVHGDVTPSNVFVTYEGEVKVLDFGIVRAAAHHLPETSTEVLEHRLSYMSPEAARGENVDRRSDLFSVGIMLWEAATGVRFWQDHDDVAIYQRLTRGDLPTGSHSSRIENSGLFHIVTRALAIDPTQRYPTAADMQGEIDELLVQRGKNGRGAALRAYMETFFAVEREEFQKVVRRGLVRDSVRAEFRGLPLGEENVPRAPAARPRGAVSKTLRGRRDEVMESRSSSVSPFETSALDADIEPGDGPRPRARGYRAAFWGMAVAACLAGAAFLVQARWRDPKEAQTPAPAVAASWTKIASFPARGALSAVTPTQGAAPAATSSETQAGSAAMPARSAKAHLSLDGEPAHENPAAPRRKPHAQLQRVPVGASEKPPSKETIEERRDAVEELPKSRRPPRPLDPEDPWNQ